MGALWAEPQLLLGELAPCDHPWLGAVVTLVLAVGGVVTPMKGNGLMEQETSMLWVLENSGDERGTRE